MVDGVLASCYASVDHDLAHIVMTPMMRFPQITEWIFGEDYGLKVYVQMAQEIGNWVLPTGQWFHPAYYVNQ